MPETINAEDVRPEDIIADDVFPDDDPDDIDDPEENADLEDNSTETVVEESGAVSSTSTYTHSPELVEKAAHALFTSEEISVMSPEALRLAILGANRVGQAIFEANRKPEAKPTEEVVDEWAVFDDPEKYDPAFIQPIKSHMAKLTARLEKVEKENETLRSKTGQAEAQTVHSRLMGVAADVAPELVKAFDTSTPAGKAKYTELLTIMQGVWTANKGLPEKQIFQRAIKAMDIIPEKPKESPVIAQKKREWDDAANAQPTTTRQRGETAVEAVGKILAARRLQDKARRTEDRRTNGKKQR